MKKMLLAVSVFCIQYTFAQTIVDFEELVVPGADSAWLGSTGEGGFTSKGVFFENTYTVATWGDYWSGFVYSNSTDVTTPGSSNDYSAYAGEGANGSNNYVVSYGGEIDLNSEKLISSIQVTNTTYAALSMLNGDSFGKQFGSPNGANGNPDGTNGADWFKLTVFGKNGSGNYTDSVDFYLADYRFTDNADDYIVDTWESIDLTSLGSVRYLEFRLESSDMSGPWINTPGYFALDNITYGTASANALSLAKQEVYPNPTNGKFTVKSPEGQINVYALSGELILSQTTSGIQEIDLNAVQSGTYLIETITSEGIARTRISKI